LKGRQNHSRRLARAVASKTIQELAMTVSHGLITKKIKMCENVWNKKCKKFKRDGGWEKEKMHHLGCAFRW
jgi:hypothetical protein